MTIEFPIKMGNAKKRADIVIFERGAPHKQENIYLIIETKKETIRPSNINSGVDQLESYVAASPNCQFSLWIGSERLAFKVKTKKGKRILDKIPDIPRFGETSIPKPVRGGLVPALNLKLVFRRIHNYIYANQGLQKDKAFEELQK